MRAPGRRHLPLAALAFAALVSVAAVGIAAARLQAQWQLEATLQRNGIWAASTALAEFYRLRTAQLEWEAGQAESAAVEQRFEIMLSRLRLMRGTSEDGVNALGEGLRREAEAIELLADDVERAQQARLAGDAGAPLEGSMTVLGARLTAITYAHHTDRLTALASRDDGLSALQRTLAISLAGLVLSAAVLSAMVVREAGRSRRSLLDARGARDMALHLAEHDALTGLLNRAGFGAALSRALRGVPATAGADAERGLGGGATITALHCLDLDRFKEVNDGLGHPAGDRLLLAAAARMAGCLRAGDTLARLGGDEFAVIQRAAGPADASALAVRLVDALGHPFVLDGCTILSGASLGTALAPAHARDAEGLMQRADIALYRAKADGRGRAAIFDPEMETSLRRRRSLEAELRAAIEGETLRLVFQPKFSLPDLAPSGVEALVRWDHPERGPISPAVFVPVAEESGLMGALTRFVLRQALRQAREWRDGGRRIPVAVNLSAQDFSCGLALDTVREALAESGAEPELLEVEVTEGVFIRNAETAGQTVQALRRMGVRVSLDDFGTGYSSLAYLQRLPVNTVKLDRAFVSALSEDGARGTRIADAVVRLAHGLDARVVAEGVERPEQLRQLSALGCDEAQGFLLARPAAPDEVWALFAPVPADPLLRAVG